MKLAGSHASASINIIDNDDPPIISIVGGDAVNEGDSAEFVIFTNQASSQSKDIVVTLSEIGSFVTDGTTGENATRTVTLPANQLEAVLMIPTTANVAPEDDGLITATLTPPADAEDYQSRIQSQ